MRVIKSIGEYRIIEHEDDSDEYMLATLKGDCFDPSVNPEIDPLIMLKEEREFERKVESEGVFGYALERWNPAIGKGWEHVDSCWGFVGAYDSTVPEFNHYIVAELESAIKEVINESDY